LRKNKEEDFTQSTQSKEEDTEKIKENTPYSPPAFSASQRSLREEFGDYI